MAARQLLSVRSWHGRLNPAHTTLMVCDVQERFRKLIVGMPMLIDNSRRLIKGCVAAEVPIILTEQVPSKLGSTVHELTSVLPPEHSTEKVTSFAILPSTPGSTYKTFAKTQFSMCTPEVMAHLKTLVPVPEMRQQVLLVGIEAHVCVLQTALDLLAEGHEVHLIVDAVSSQKEEDRTVAIRRLVQAGCLLANHEMVMFQLCQDANAPMFKAISDLAKGRPPSQSDPSSGSLHSQSIGAM